jgi:hypothetical protein
MQRSKRTGKIKRISPNARVFHLPPQPSPRSGQGEIAY